MSKTYRACLVGCGRMGATIDDEVRDRADAILWLPLSHAAACVACDRTELVAVSDVLAEKAEAIRQRYGAPRCYTDYREMIERERPEILCIATRPRIRAEVTIFAAEQGVPGIYCEKPLCSSMAEADAMAAAVRKHEVKFNYGAQRRFMPFYRKLRELIDAGELGQIQSVIAQYGGVSSAFWGLTHAAAVLLYFAGDPEVDFVQGTIVSRDEDWEANRINSDPGISNGYFRFANGVHGYHLVGSGAEFEVVGTDGKLHTLNNGLSCLFRKATPHHRMLEEVPLPDPLRESGTLAGIRDTAEALDTGRETQGPIEVAHRGMEMLIGLIESHRQGGARVSLPLKNREFIVGPPNW